LLPSGQTNAVENNRLGATRHIAPEQPDLSILKVWGQAKTGKHSHDHLEELLSQHGFMNRLFDGRLQKVINHSWQMYPVDLLFGLGFDTASEVALLAMTAGSCTAVTVQLPITKPKS
jgi:high-affinity nickel-transport protein